MENKYYTPSIEEFHLGFEFEQLKDVNTKLINRPNFQYVICTFDTSHSLSRIIKELKDNSNKVRVKFLDKGDIEKLGWEYAIVDTEGKEIKYGYEKYHPDSKEDMEKWYTLELLEGTKYRIVYKYYRNLVGQEWDTLRTNLN